MENMIVTFDYVGMDGKIKTEVYRTDLKKRIISDFWYTPAYKLLLLHLESIVSFSVYYFDKQGKYAKETYIISNDSKRFNRTINASYESVKKQLVINWLNQNLIDSNEYLERDTSMDIDFYYGNYSNLKSYQELNN